MVIETTTASGGTKRVQKGIATPAQAEAIAKVWRAEGFRVGVSYESATDTRRVDGNRKAAK